MSRVSHASNWFEIAVTEMDRAARFYETVLGAPIRRDSPNYTGKQVAILPYEEPGSGGALVHDPKRTPGGGGSLVYLNVNGKLDACIARVAAAGGTVLAPKVDIGPAGFIAIVRDSEGNTVGLHSER